MKRALCLAITALAIGLATCPQAQSYNLKLTYRIPFSFTADTAEFPAGEYEVTEPSRWILKFRNVTNQHSAFEHVTPARSGSEANGRGRLIFHRYGNKYFLVEVSDGSIESTYDLRGSIEEKRLADITPRPQLKVVSVLAD